MQNIVIFFMSTFPPNTISPTTGQKLGWWQKLFFTKNAEKKQITSPKPATYKDQTGQFQENCIHTSETALKYFDWKLQQKNEKIDHVLAIVTDKAKEQLPRFKNLFPDKEFQITPIELNGEINLDQSFHTVSNLFSETMKQIKDPANATIHIDFTGGLRHTAMLLLALMQMFKFTGVRTGLVTYTNFQSKKIEDATPLVNMFTLIGGTNEFKSFGVANHIQEYFNNIPEISPSLSKLIEAIQLFSDKIKVCSNVEDMNNAVNELKENLDLYNTYLSMKFPKEPQEELFSKLLPFIEKDFQELIARANTPTYELGLIRWCMKKELLQQAATLYTQWIPKFMIQNKLIEIIDKNIITDCKNQGQLWNSWEVGLFKSYTYSVTSLKGFNIPNLRRLINNKTKLSDILQFIPSDETILKEFFATAAMISSKSKSNWYRSLMKLPNTHVVIQLFNETKKQPILNSYLKTRILNSTSVEDLFYPDFNNAKTEFITNKILLNKTYAKTNEKIPRELVFKNMLDNRVITTILSEKDLLTLVKNYTTITDIRNSINHASSKELSEFKNTIKENLEILARYVN